MCWHVEMGKKKPLRSIGHTTKEVYTNDQHLKVSSLQGVLDPTRHDLSELLSIKMERNNGSRATSREFVIDAKDYSYYITTQQGLDLFFSQFNKATGETITYTPYSHAGYDFFAQLVAGYYHFFKSSPVANFTDCDIQEWKESARNRDLPLNSELTSFYMDMSLYSYLFHEELFKKDEQGVYRFHHPIDESRSGREKNGLGFTENEMILKITHHYPGGTEIGPLEFHINKHVLQILLQAYIDINRYVSGSVANYNVKKVKDAVVKVMQDPDARNDEKGLDIITEIVRGREEETQE